MIYRDAKAMAEAMHSMGHDPQYVQVGTGQVVTRFTCTKCGKSGFHRNDGGHAYGDAIGNQCGVEPVISGKTHKANAPSKKKRDR